jgi:hypothetical protein
VVRVPIEPLFNHIDVWCVTNDCHRPDLKQDSKLNLPLWITEKLAVRTKCERAWLWMGAGGVTVRQI